MHILGIESSCDETSAALVHATESNITVLAEKTASQIAIHEQYGGVVPEVAGRAHAENVMPVIEAVLAGSPAPDVIAVTAGPGLVTGLVVGVEASKALSYLRDIPIVRTNHIEGHILSVLLNEPPEIAFPAVCLVVSGGHTELILMTDFGHYELIGKTRDDAAGEAFDKVAKLLGLEYPGGPKISELAKKGDSTIPFPRPMKDEENYDFSFAGLKTAARYWLRDHELAAVHVNPLHRLTSMFGQAKDAPTMADFCASFEAAVTDVLVSKTVRAVQEYRPQTVIIGGGVSANTRLRETLARELPGSCVLRVPALHYAMDNGAMIAAAAYHHAKKKAFTSWKELRVDPNWKIYE